MAKKFELSDAKSANIVTIEDDRGEQAVHDLIVAYRANRRSGTAHTKTRGEVSATGKKPFRQKGTGRARQGGNANPIHRGGGVVFGPRNTKIYGKNVTKRVRKLAFAKSLTERIKDGDVFSGTVNVESGKTKDFVAELKKLTDAKKVLLIGKFEAPTLRSSGNVPNVLLMSPEEVNAEHLLHYDRIFLAGDALETLARRTQGVLPKKETAQPAS